MNYQISASQLKMENSLEKRELVAMFMESPFYFELRLRERLALVQHHQRRFSLKVNARQSGSFDKVGPGMATGAIADTVVAIMAGSNSPEKIHPTPKPCLYG
jgi:hypothetical protein